MTTYHAPPFNGQLFYPKQSRPSHQIKWPRYVVLIYWHNLEAITDDFMCSEPRRSEVRLRMPHDEASTQRARRVMSDEPGAQQSKIEQHQFNDSSRIIAREKFEWSRRHCKVEERGTKFKSKSLDTMLSRNLCWTAVGPLLG